MIFHSILVLFVANLFSLMDTSSSLELKRNKKTQPLLLATVARNSCLLLRRQGEDSLEFGNASSADSFGSSKLLKMYSKDKRPYDPESLPPTARLRRNVVDLYSGNDISSMRSQDINEFL